MREHDSGKDDSIPSSKTLVVDEMKKAPRIGGSDSENDKQ